jgi:uncharacterized membrane protein YfcA
MRNFYLLLIPYSALCGVALGRIPAPHIAKWAIPLLVVVGAAYVTWQRTRVTATEKERPPFRIVLLLVYFEVQAMLLMIAGTLIGRYGFHGR